MAKKDIIMTTREAVFIFWVIIPILGSLILNAALGSVGTGTPSMGIIGGDDFVSVLENDTSIRVTVFSSEKDLREAVLLGEYDSGLIVPSEAEFLEGKIPKLLISGESLLNERITIGAALLGAFREFSGAEDLVTYETILIGEEEFSLQTRITPTFLIVAAIVGGLIISMSLIEEREKKTLYAVMVTPITPLEVILAKSLYGLFLGLVLGILILILNNSFGGELYLVMVFLILGILFSVGIGLMAGVVMDNITDLLARMKIFNIFLWFPAIVILFPQIPQWIGKIFPTYYFVHPILLITQKG
ncbi:MAG: ABC transporter permease, partial [Candidatus Methanofastidiosia archaeon]